ncbi:MAG: hypothetical protein ACYTBJ_19345 [Planctomycetota bacterium]|jgi:hypothetical protein
MFKTIWLTAAIVVGMGWIAYGIWRIIERLREKRRPKPTTKHLGNVRKSFDEYTKKMENYKKPTYKREDLR